MCSGWFRSFSKRYGFQFHKTHGQANSTDPMAIPKEKERIQGIIEAFLLQHHTLNDVFNIDEKSFELVSLPEYTFVTLPKSGFKASKERFTVCFVTNATGTAKVDNLLTSETLTKEELDNVAEWMYNAASWIMSALV